MNAQSCIRTSSPALRQQRGEYSPRLFGNPASMVWPPHTCCVWPLSSTPKIPLYCTEYNRPTSRSYFRLYHYVGIRTIPEIWWQNVFRRQNWFRFILLNTSPSTIGSAAQARLRPGSGQAQARLRPGSGQAQARLRPGSGQAQARLKPGSGHQAQARLRPGIGQVPWLLT